MFVVNELISLATAAAGLTAKAGVTSDTISEADFNAAAKDELCLRDTRMLGDAQHWWHTNGERYEVLKTLCRMVE